MDRTRVNSLLIIVTVLFNHTAAAWQTSVALDLDWPDISAGGEIPENEGRAFEFVDNFPCANIYVPENQPRVAFPVSGLGPRYDLHNASTGQPQFTSYYFISEVFIGQLSSDVSEHESGWAYVGADIIKGLDGGPVCGTDINLAWSSTFEPPPTLTLRNYDLVGANATLGLRVTLIDANDGIVKDDTFQCSYITFVAANTFMASDGLCNPNTGYAPTASSPMVSFPSDTGQAQPSSTHSAPQNSKNNSVKVISIAVPVGLCAPLIILITLIFVQRRRRAGSKKHKSTSVSKSLIHGHPQECEAPEIEIKRDQRDEDEDRDSGSHDRASVHSEPLPLYQLTAIEEGGGRM